MDTIILKNFKNFLIENKYYYTQVIPLRKYNFSRYLISNEIFNFLRFSFKKTNMFGISFFPETYEYIFNKKYPKIFLLYKLFIKNIEITKKNAITLFGYPLFNQIMNKFIYIEKNKIKSNIRIVPYNKYLFITDGWNRNINNFVYLSYDSLVFAKIIRNLLKTKHYKKMLDIGCGTGILSMNLIDNADDVVGIDINNRSINYSHLNLKFNEEKIKYKKINFYCKNVFNINKKYDLIISNPPYVLLNKKIKKESWIDSDGGNLGIEFTIKLFNYISNILENNGTSIIFTRAPIRNNDDLLYKIIKTQNKYFNITYIYLSRDKFFIPTKTEINSKINEYRTVMIILKYNKSLIIKKKYNLNSIILHKF